MIETSVNISIGLAAMLADSAKQNGVTKQSLVHKLFCKVLKESRLSKPTLFKRVTYQKADPCGQWKNEPITLRPDIYEKCHDARRVLKMSVSLLFAYAIRTYLSQAIQELTAKSTYGPDKTYNYWDQYSIQCIFSTIADGFIIKWSKSPKKRKTFPDKSDNQ